MSMIVMVNEKFREDVQDKWECFHSTDSQKFASFFQRVIELLQSLSMTMAEKSLYLVFLTHCFQSLEDHLVRPLCLSLVSLRLWHCISEDRVDDLLESQTKLQLFWKALSKEEAKEREGGAEPPAKKARKGGSGSQSSVAGRKDQEGKGKAAATTLPPSLQRTFMPMLLDDFFSTLFSMKEESSCGEGVQYCEYFLTLIIDLLSQIPTRRFAPLFVWESPLFVWE